MSDLIARTSLASLGLGRTPPSKQRRRADNVPPGHKVHDIGRTDSLAGIAMKYGTTTTVLKKLNQLWSERDMFSRSTLIVPEREEDATQLNESRSRKVREWLASIQTISEDEVSATKWLSKNEWSLDKAVTAYWSHVEQERLRELDRSPMPILQNSILQNSYSSAEEEELGDPTGFYGIAGASGMISSAAGKNQSSEFGTTTGDNSFFEL